MGKYKLTKDWIKENSGLLKKAYSVVKTQKYDLKSKTDVLEVLKVVDLNNATEENAKVFSKILQLFDLKMRESSARKRKVKEIN